jgi:hypothetical protein
MGLIRGVARTAVVAGTATAVSNRVSRRQSGRWAAQEEQAYAGQQTYPQQAQQQPHAQQEYPQEIYVPSTAGQAPASSVDLAQLKELAELRSQGVLTEAEFQTQKARLLNG